MKTQTRTQQEPQPATTVVRTLTNADGGTTSVRTITNVRGAGAGETEASSSSAAAIANGGNSGSGGSDGLSTGAMTAIAVVIPVAVVALLVGLGIFFWRKRKSKKSAEEQRRKEVEEYNYNPNGDPTLPAIGSDAGGAQMSEDHSSGYRGWGALASSNRKASTTLSGGHTQQLSDSGSNMYGNPSSPGGNYSDGHSSDPIMQPNRDTMNSDDLGALGVAPAAGTGNKSGLRRGPSNASSAYSAGDHSETSDDPPPMPGPPGQAYDNSHNNGYGYGQHGPYGDGSYGGGDGGMPVVRDLNARRNTRIQPGGSYQQGNSGIAQNF